jgi:uncharacterized protein
MKPALGLSAQPQIGIGEVRHTRLWPREHRFAYATWFLMLPLRSWGLTAQGGPARNRAAYVSFHDRDHGAGGPDALAWFDALLHSAGIADADGEVWLHTFPRILGYVFKPVSFWYAHRRDGSLAAILAEVNNTFGERHCYLLHEPALAWGQGLQARKVFHVSPFLPVSGQYRFRFMRAQDAQGQERTVARIELHDEPGLVLSTSVSGRLQPWSAALQRRVLLRMPLLTLGVMARIHWQALQLWRKRLPFFSKPAPPVPAQAPQP